MANVRIAVTALAVTLSAAGGAAYLEEDFDGETFPPAGWSIITENRGSNSIGWERAGGENGCAHGFIAGDYGHGGSTTLVTKSVRLNEGSAAVSFERYDAGYGGAYYWLEIQLRRGSQGLWRETLPRAEWWKPIRINFPILTTDDHEVAWLLEAYFGVPSVAGAAHLYVDNVVIEENTAVDPTSLGRVKALYH